MKIKIISEGLSTNTKIINAETGESIENVTALKWECSVGHLATAEIKFINFPIEAIGETEIMGENELINKIESIRARNNKNWMTLLRLALKHTPEEGQKIMRNIVDCDSEINKLTSRLAGGNKK